jgi:hypothetical protein
VAGEEKQAKTNENVKMDSNIVIVMQMATGKSG